jgi:hypothetical protein
MLFSLLLTFGLLAACGNPDDLDDNLKARLNGGNDKYGSNNLNQYPTYEVNWVLDRQVIDKTVIRNIDNQRLEITNMPNEVLLRHLLTNEQQNLPIKQLTSLYYTYTTVGYNTSMYYNKSTDDKSDERRFLVKIDQQIYHVWIDESQVGGTYDQNADQWTLEWKIKKISIVDVVSSFYENKDWTFDPELTLMLISTKRLN